MSKEEIIKVVQEELQKEGIYCANLSKENITFYYDGLCEEDYTTGGTAVENCPVWYGSIHNAFEQLSIAIYGMGEKICIAIRHFADKIFCKDLLVTI